MRYRVLSFRATSIAEFLISNSFLGLGSGQWVHMVLLSSQFELQLIPPSTVQINPQYCMNPIAMASESSDIVYRAYLGESDLPHIMALVQSELSEPYVIYTYRYFLHQWYVCIQLFYRTRLTICVRPHLSFLVSKASSRSLW